MVSAVRKLTGVGGDVRQIARLLQKKAPPGHMLAYINQEEADLLKARGGSGKPHANTGIPSFDEEGIGAAYQYQPQDYSNPPAEYTAETPPAAAPVEAAPATQGAEPSAGAYLPVSTPASGADFPSYQYQYPSADMPAESARLERMAAITPAAITPGVGAGAAQDLDLLGRASKATGLKEETLQKLGIGGLQALVGGIQARQASQAGQAAKEEMAAMAAPYRAQAQELITKAQRGELTPVGQQQLQAVQAQAAQGAEKRGGVGAQQAAVQVEAFRQQLLQQQLDYGFKLSGIADNIMTGAIKTGIQADQYVNNLTSNYFNNIARTMYGQAPQVAVTPGAQ